MEILLSLFHSYMRNFMQYNRQCINITMQSFDKIYKKSETAKMSIRNMHVGDIRRAMGEIASYHERD